MLEDSGTMSDLLRDSVIFPVRASGGDMNRPYAIVIGKELPHVNPALERFSFVGVAYSAGGEVLGTVGVMGPTRMKYADAITLVPALAARLQVCLETM
jgi:transcriptional regulator of heat shock response